MDESSRIPHERVLIWDRIDANKWRTVLLILGFVVFTALFFAAIGTVIAAYAGVSSNVDPTLTGQIAVATALVATVIGVIMYYAATATVLAISGAPEVTVAEEPELYRVVENLSIGSGLPMPGVWVIEDSAPNAFGALSSTRSERTLPRPVASSTSWKSASWRP